jgi:hypothetical protein
MTWSKPGPGRPEKPPRLMLRPSRKQKPSAWLIVYRGYRKHIGLREPDRKAAEAKLQDYIRRLG